MPVQNKDSGLKSGSREIYLPQSFEALNPVQGKFVYYKTLKLSISGLRISGSKRIYLSQSSNSQEKLKGPKRVGYKAQPKHKYPALMAIGS